LQIPDDAVTITDDTIHISLQTAQIVDQFSFPGGAGNNLGTAGVPATLSFDITYSKAGASRHVEPTSSDPLSPFNWEGEMWKATNHGTFSVKYKDTNNEGMTWSIEDGSFDSAGNFGEMGFERNGSFVQERRDAEGHREHVREVAKLPVTPAWPSPTQNQSNVALAQNTQGAQEAPSGPKFRGKIPIRELIH
jgi:hypothetical protein